MTDLERQRAIAALVSETHSDSVGAMMNYLNYSLELPKGAERISDIAERIEDVPNSVLTTALRVIRGDLF